MTDDETLMQQALEALELAYAGIDAITVHGKAITALKERLAQPEQKPVGEVINERGEVDWISFVPSVGSNLYTTPPQRNPWVGLTEDEWKELWEKFNDGQDGLEEEFQERMTVKHGKGYYLVNPEESWKSQQELIQRLVEAKLKEKNT